MDPAWERLLDLIDHLAGDPSRALDQQIEQTFMTLCAEAPEIDNELHLPDIARWLVGLAAAHRTIRASHPDIDPDNDLANLRRIVTRWLHPTRPR